VVFLAGAVAGVSPFVFSIFLINVYVTTEWLANEYFDGVIEAMAGGSGAAGFGVFMAQFGTPALSLAAVVGAAMFVGRRVGPSAMVHGFFDRSIRRCRGERRDGYVLRRSGAV
jgi:hypothetical protein